MVKEGEIQRFKIEDLLLKVKYNVNRDVWDEGRYEAFLEQLCGDREYQKIAIYTTLRYLLSSQYSCLKDLALENWEENEIIREKYGTEGNFERHLQLPDKLSATIDLATGTGKSYVIYGIAAILLAEGIVDRVLVLCPSTTIEEGLKEKFKLLARNSDLIDALPLDSKLTTPRIIDASETITAGCICVENRDAVYEHVKSSVKASLWGKGSSVAVLNDEVHHVANQPQGEKKKWKEFLENPEYEFNIIMGFSGTCYVENEYLSDVIYRYSLRDAMEQRVVKNINYVAEEPKTGEDSGWWQIVYNRHDKLKKELKKKNIIPLAILVTSNITKCKGLGQELIDFLVNRESIDESEVMSKVLIIYNNAPDVLKLKDVDKPESKIEWIVSVSMLTEGWDVKRVFEIIPHEERAFNSKLLIAQVLGRGLRMPEGWVGQQPEVTVFNHAAWANGIRHLVNEILENEKRLTSKIVSDSNYHFGLHNIEYKINEKNDLVKKKGPYNILKDDLVDIPSEGEIIDVTIDFEKAVYETRESWKTVVHRKMYTPEEVAAQMYNTLQMLDLETMDMEDPEERTAYAKEYPYDRLLDIVKRSLKGDQLCSERNRQRFLAAVGTIRRPATKIVRYEFIVNNLKEINTTERPNDSVNASSLKRDKVVFVTEKTRLTLDEEQLEFFNDVKEPDSDYKCFPLNNIYDFKTPLNLVIADAGTERDFVRALIQPENVGSFDAWIKSTKSRFYPIDYAWRKGSKTKRGSFNPDFFIKKENKIIVIEIKDNDELRDPSDENIKKNEFAVAHFGRLNRLLRDNNIDIKYYFHFLIPLDYPEFFKRLREGTIDTFRSKIDVKLSDALNS